MVILYYDETIHSVNSVKYGHRIYNHLTDINQIIIRDSIPYAINGLSKYL